MEVDTEKWSCTLLCLSRNDRKFLHSKTQVTDLKHLFIFSFTVEHNISSNVAACTYYPNPGIPKNKL
jgi:hypothetical protein